MSEHQAPPGSPLGIARIGVASAIVMLAFGRALAINDPFPYFGLNPMETVPLRFGFGPTSVLILDALLLLLSGVALACESASGRRVRGVPVLLVGLAAVPIFVHGWGLERDAFDHARLGATWLASLAAAVALLHLARDPAIRRVVLATFSGLAVILALKGGLQLAVELPETVRAFEASDGSGAAAQGWSDGSAAARSFERRLRSGDAFGWFGLSNVYASYMGAAFVLSVVLLFGVVRSGPRKAKKLTTPPLLAWVCLNGAAFLGLWLSHSKGAIGATAFGLGAAVVLAISTRLPARVSGLVRTLVGLSAVALPLLAVVARGAMAERIDELSILFRWFYVEAATRIFGGHPLLGVGPSGFKDAYLLAKNPLSPEEVTSPHSVLLDYAATLGLGGLCAGALVVLLAVWSARAGAGEREAETPPADRRVEFRTIGLLLAGVTMLGAWAELESATPDQAVLRIVGLALAVAVGIGVAALAARSDRAARLALSAAGLALIAHAQIEVTPVWQSSAPLFFVLLGAGAAGAGARVVEGRRWAGLLGVPFAVFGLVVLIAWVPPVRSWERLLTEAGEALRPPMEFRVRMQAVGSGSGSFDSFERIARDFAQASQSPVASSPEALWGQIEGARLAAGERARTLGEPLEDSTHHETLRALSSLAMSVAFTRDGMGLDPGPALADAAALADRSGEQNPGKAGAWSWIGTVRRAGWELSGDDGELEVASEALERQAGLDPHGLSAPLRLYEIEQELGDWEGASRWGERALEIDERLRLDPLRRLTDEQREAIEEFVKGP